MSGGEAEVSAAELERRRKISESARTSAARQAYYARIRGKKKGPDSIETRARKSASHLAKRGTRGWQVYYDLALGKLRLENAAKTVLDHGQTPLWFEEEG